MKNANYSFKKRIIKVLLFYFSNVFCDLFGAVAHLLLLFRKKRENPIDTIKQLSLYLF